MDNPATRLPDHFLEFDQRAGEIIMMISDDNRFHRDYDPLLAILVDKDAVYEAAILVAVLELKNLISIKGIDHDNSRSNQKQH